MIDWLSCRCAWFPQPGW